MAIKPVQPLPEPAWRDSPRQPDSRTAGRAALVEAPEIRLCLFLYPRHPIDSGGIMRLKRRRDISAGFQPLRQGNRILQRLACPLRQ